MVLTRIAWAAIVTSASMVSYDLQVRVWHTVHAFIVIQMYNRCMKCKVFYRYFRRRIAVKQKAFEGRLERKRIERQIKESQIPYSHCKNCGTELQGVYCHNCGQYAKDLKQSFCSYIMEYLSNTYNLDLFINSEKRHSIHKFK